MSAHTIDPSRSRIALHRARAQVGEFRSSFARCGAVGLTRQEARTRRRPTSDSRRFEARRLGRMRTLVEPFADETLARRFMALASARNYTALAELLDPDVVWYGTRGGIDAARVVRGPDAYLAYMREVLGTFERYEFEVEETFRFGAVSSSICGSAARDVTASSWRAGRRSRSVFGRAWSTVSRDTSTATRRVARADSANEPRRFRFARAAAVRGGPGSTQGPEIATNRLSQTAVSRCGSFQPGRG